MIATLLACRASPKATVNCAAELNARNRARKASEEYDPKMDPTPLPIESSDEGDQVVYVRQYYLATMDKWVDEFYLGLFRQAFTDIGETWREGSSSYRSRPATEGDLKRDILDKEWSRAARLAEACIKKTCAALETLKAQATRLYDLHKSENTARELQAAESGWEQCVATDADDPRRKYP